MLFVVGTFVLVLGIVYGLYWLFIERAESEEQSALKKRLKKASGPRKLAAALLKERDKLSDVGMLDNVLTSFGHVVEPMQRTIAQAGLQITVSTVLLASACLAGLTYIVVTTFLRMPLVGVAAAIAMLFVPYGLVRMKRTRRMIKFEEQFPEAIDLLARALRAGHALTTGLSMVADEMAEPVGPEFRLLFDQQNYGMPLPQAMKAFADRIPILDARFFVTAVLTQREAGGNLSEVLDNLSSIIRDRFRVKRQVRVISAHGRITGWILSALPVSLGLFFAFSSPEVYKKFYTDPLGIQLIIGALVLQVIGVFVIKKIVTIGPEAAMYLNLPILLVAVFSSVALAAAALASLALSWTTPEQRQIRRLSQRTGEGVLAQLNLAEAPAPWVKRFQQIVPKSPKDMTRLRRRLSAAGYRSLTAAVVYGASETLMPFIVGGMTLMVFGFSRWYFALLGAAFGFVLPSVWLGRQTALRQKQIRNGLPDALDLMIVCIEAGSGIDQSIMRTSDELDITYPALAEEFRLITTEMRAGKPRLEAFKNFASRTKVDEVRSLVSMLIQTDRFGTSIAQALRTHAEVARTKRRQNAEERAGKIGVKLVFPLVFCLFPSLYVAILGPAVIEYFRLFKPQIVERQAR